jgi:hypothetical protein
MNREGGEIVEWDGIHHPSLIGQGEGPFHGCSCSCNRGPSRVTRKEVEREIRDLRLHFSSIIDIDEKLVKRDDGLYAVKVGPYTRFDDLKTIREYLRGLWTGLCLSEDKNREERSS